MPEWLQNLLVIQAIAFAGWCVRQEVRMSRIEGKTQGLDEINKSIQRIDVSMATFTEQMKTLFRLVDGGKHGD